MIQITPVENGFMITTYTGRQASSQDTTDLINNMFTAAGNSEDPIASAKKAFEQMALKSSTRRKSIEHHVAKSSEETIKLVSEILGTMKV